MTARTWGMAELAAHLRVPSPAADKYRRGVLGMRTGSAAYPGAAVLSTEAAWRTGVGLLRYAPPLGDRLPALGLPTPAAAVLTARPETVFIDGPLEANSCDAWVVGSGTDPAHRSFAETAQINRLLRGTAPVIVDAGALDLLVAERPSAPVIATPHRGEFMTLWRSADLGGRPQGWSDDRSSTPSLEALVGASEQLATALGVVVLLKGSRTVVVSPDGFAAVCGPASSWLAAAGTGDVLAGVLGALVATHAADLLVDQRPLQTLGQLGATAAVLHDAAARIAAGDGHGHDGHGHPITALDVAHALPAAIATAPAPAPSDRGQSEH